MDRNSDLLVDDIGNTGLSGLGQSTTGIGGQMSGSTSGGQMSEDSVGDTASQESGKKSSIAGKASEGASMAKEKATSGTDTLIEKAAGGLESLSSTMSSKSESMGSGQIQSIAGSAAGTLAQGAEMLRGRDSEQMMSDLEELVRKKPLESLLVAAGVGYLISRAL